MNPHIILGPPGTGKTRYLIDTLERELEQVPPHRVAFASFTKKASHVGASRACERFGFDSKELPYFKTLHSLAFSRLGLRRDEVMQHKDYRQIGKHLGLEFSTRTDIEEGLPAGKFKGDRYIFLDGFARARMLKPEDAWRALGGEDGLDWFEFKRFRGALQEFKHTRGLLDFSDMLEQLSAPLDIDVAIIDEAQDLSSLQWDFARRAFCNAKRIYIAVDDDQAIYQWSGADVSQFQALQGHQTVLHQSHRVPRAVFNTASRISNRIRHRYKKPYAPKSEEGLVQYYLSPDDVDLSSGTWLLLARNVYQLPSLVAMVRASGYNYLFRGEQTTNRRHLDAIEAWGRFCKGLSYDGEALESFLWKGASPEKLKGRLWHEVLTGIPAGDREYYIAMHRRKEKLFGEPRINIGTGHSSKGGEADNVLLLTDMSSRTFESYQIEPDAEHRVFYVMATRAKQSLHIIQPQTRLFYDI